MLVIDCPSLQEFHSVGSSLATKWIPHQLILTTFVGLPGRWNGTTVAVKIIEHGSSGRMAGHIHREVDLAISVSHPNVVSLGAGCSLLI